MKARHVAIEGPIGVGKTALARLLAARFDARQVLEAPDNPFLADFYKDQKGSAFATQIWFLIARHQQWKGLAQGDLFQDAIVSDYIFEKERIFAALNLDDSELATYERLFRILAADAPRPDLVIYLQARVKHLMSRIQRRGRGAERRISEGYLAEVVKAYDRFFFRYEQAPLLVVDTNETDFTEGEGDLDHLIERIEAMDRGGVEYYHP